MEEDTLRQKLSNVHYQFTDLLNTNTSCIVAGRISANQISLMKAKMVWVGEQLDLLIKG